MPQTTYLTSYTHPLRPILPSFTPRILTYHNQVNFFSSHLSTGQSVVNPIPTNHPKKQAHEHQAALLELAKTRLEGVIEMTTKVVTAQLRRPNRALTKNAEMANEEIEKELIGVAEVLDELKYLVRLGEESQ